MERSVRAWVPSGSLPIVAVPIPFMLVRSVCYVPACSAGASLYQTHVVVKSHTDLNTNMCIQVLNIHVPDVFVAN